jgi:hypothetical protein
MPNGGDPNSELETFRFGPQNEPVVGHVWYEQVAPAKFHPDATIFQGGEALVTKLQVVDPGGKIEGGSVSELRLPAEVSFHSKINDAEVVSTIGSYEFQTGPISLPKGLLVRDYRAHDVQTDANEFEPVTYTWEGNLLPPDDLMARSKRVKKLDLTPWLAGGILTLVGFGGVFAVRQAARMKAEAR